LDESPIQLKKIPSYPLKYYSSIDKIVNQPDEEYKKWIRLFE